jgi:hypothetical protein
MGNDALIGFSGFVGQSLWRQHFFEACFNTSNIDSIAGRQFETLVCAAAPGSMITANTAPELDRKKIHALVERLERVRANCFILISSIAVLPNFGSGVDEGTKAFEERLAYGRNRRELEVFCENHFDNCLVVRLPALFGEGLRKNFIFDLLNPVPSMLNLARLEMLLGQLPQSISAKMKRLYILDSFGVYNLNREALKKEPWYLGMELAIRATHMSAMQFHNPETTYQFYDIERLWSDISVAKKSALRYVHFAPEPLRARDIHVRLVKTEMPENDARLHFEDMRTRHSALWNRDGPYLEDAASVMNKLEAFFIAQNVRL